MRIKLFAIANKTQDEDGAINLPDGWWPFNTEPSEMGYSYVWAYELPEEDPRQETPPRMS